ncbi:Spindle assembly checkpoint component MAD1 [Pseudocercospora fuligena]|uniref:Spindle assembly checkpoint component MAD1 n=1 Tax=Pseudocercospora fuligena TaxID=685502 RepID=A0A8H6VGN0_9PEZI|nr:Spindle assembly checkpoint component MAD1 [Pseudocercospora fuligena]
MARNQPTFDFLAGGEPSPPRRQPLRETMKQSTVSRADINNEDLRAQLRTVQYELDSLKQERELNELRHQQELREVQNRAESDYKRAQAAENASTTATKKAEALSRDWQENQDRAANEKLQLEKKVRSLQDDNRSLRDDLEEAKADLESAGRQNQHAFSELEQKYVALQTSFEECQQDLSGRVASLQTTQQKLARKEAEVGELENEVLRLKAQTGDSDTLAVIKKELTEQVTYIRKLEATNREQLAELKQTRSAQKSVEIVEEEKRALEAKLHMLEDLRKELAESQLQKQILEDEKRSWTAYLEANAANEEDMRYETPEQMAKALLQERIERVDLMDKLGAIQPELKVLEQNLQAVEEDKMRLQAELEEARSNAANKVATAPAGDAKARARLERQKNLLTKEVEYLRAQMKTFEAEEAEFTPEQVDEAHSNRIQELEKLADQYRAEVQTLQADLSKLETQPAATLQTPRKRAREEDEAENERLGELKRKTRTLQDSLETLQKQNQLLEAELKASVSQIKSLKSTSRTRVLEFRDNPTAKIEAIKLTTLQTLREENAALLAQLTSNPHDAKSVPISTYESLNLQIQALKDELKLSEKKKLRLTQLYRSKGAEFTETIASLLGWKVDFMPNGKVKVTSILYPKSYIDGEEVENSIIFDGEQGTMKVSGGERSQFAGEISSLVEFWVEGRKEIVCFLAACTLEFYERTTRAQP